MKIVRRAPARICLRLSAFWTWILGFDSELCCCVNRTEEGEEQPEELSVCVEVHLSVQAGF